MTRTARLCCGVIGATALLAALAGPIGVMADAPSQKLLTYGATAGSWGVDIRVIPVDLKEEVTDLSDEYFPHTSVEVNATPHAIAEGEFFDPGSAIQSGPDLINGQVVVNGGPPFVPSYPYIAHTTSDTSNKRDVDAGVQSPHNPDPLLPQLTAPGAPQVSGFGVGTAHAHADASPKATSDGAVANLNLGGAVTVGSASGSSAARQAAGVVTTTTSSVLKDIAVVGVLHIATETVTAAASLNASGAETATSDLVFQGVTVAGTPATIDKDGLHIGGSDVSLAQARAAAQQLSTALAPAGGHLVTAETVRNAKDDTGTATASADGLAFAFTDPSNTTQVLVSLGHAEVLGHALSEQILTAASTPPTTVAAGGPSAPAAPLPASSGSGSSAPAAAAGSANEVTIAPTPAPSLGHSSPSVVRSRTGPPGPAQLAASQQHALFLPVVAGLAELALLSTLLVAGWMRWSPTPPSEDDLLAL